MAAASSAMGSTPETGRSAAVQRQLAEEGGVLGRHFDLPGGGKHGQQQGQIVHGAGLAHVGGGEVDGDAAVRPFEAEVFDGGVDAVAAFADSGIRQAHDGEGGHPAGHIGFDLHGKAIEPG